jgi:hypothetical protein
VTSETCTALRAYAVRVCVKNKASVRICGQFYPCRLRHLLYALHNRLERIPQHFDLGPVRQDRTEVADRLGEQQEFVQRIRARRRFAQRLRQGVEIGTAGKRHLRQQFARVR